MTQPIKRTDIYEGGDPFKVLHESLTKLQAELKLVNTELKKVKFDKSSEGVRKYNEGVKKSQSIQQQMVATSQKLREARTKEAQDLEVLKRQLLKANQERRKEAQEIATVQGSLERLRATNNKLVQQRERLNLGLKRHRQEFKKLTAQIKKNEVQLKKYDKAIGRSQRNVGNYASAFRGLGAAMGVNLGIYGIFSVLRNSIGVISKFEKQMSRVKAISGASAEEFKKLKQSAEQLGATTLFTATEIGTLQEELAKLGFSTTEILNTTEAASQLAVIAGGDLSRAAEVAGSTLRGFGMDASESQRVVDVMAASFTSSALDMERFAESMKMVAPISKAAGISLEETTAMLSKMADAGIHGSMAGTSLRRIISELNTEGKSTTEAISDLADAGLDLAGAEDEVGKRAKTALLVLADNVDTTNELTAAYENATGSAQKMADQIADNLAGDVKLLSSAWDGFILSLNKGDNQLSETLRKLTQGLKTAVEGARLLTLSDKELEQEKINQLAKEEFETIKQTINMSEDRVTALRIQKDIQADIMRQQVAEIKQLEKTFERNERLGGAWDNNNDKLQEQIDHKKKLLKIDIEATKMLNDYDVTIKETAEDTETLSEATGKLFAKYENIYNKGILKDIATDIASFRKVQQETTSVDTIQRMEKLIKAYGRLAEKIKEGGVSKIDKGDFKIGGKRQGIEAFVAPTPEKESQFDEWVDSIGQSIIEIDSIMTDIVGSGIEKRRQIAEKEVNAAEEEIKRLTSVLETERDKQERGLANNTSKIEKEIAKQTKIKKDANEEEKKIAKEQAQLTKISLLAQQAATISNMILAASELSKKSALLGPAGVPLAIASIGTLFAFFKTLSSKAEDFTKFEEGGSFVEGGKRHSAGGNKYANGIETEQGERHSIFSRKATSKYDSMIVDFTNAINKDDMSLFDLNFKNKFSVPNVIGHDYSSLLGVNEKMLSEQQQTNDYLRRTKIIKGNTETDLNGNSITHI